jgi:threonine/homoserine/homoserine lactone efflux protein
MLMAGVVYVPWLAVRLFRSPGAGREEFPLTTVSF